MQKYYTPMVVVPKFQLIFWVSDRFLIGGGIRLCFLYHVFCGKIDLSVILSLFGFNVLSAFFLKFKKLKKPHNSESNSSNEKNICFPVFKKKESWIYLWVKKIVSREFYLYLPYF